MIETEFHTSDIQALDQAINESKQLIELNECLTRLKKNRDFKRLIQDEYMTNEVNRLGLSLSDPGKDMNLMIQDLMAISALKRFLLNVEQRAFVAATNIKQDEATKAELVEELANV